MAPPAIHETGHFYFAQTGHSHFAATEICGRLRNHRSGRKLVNTNNLDLGPDPVYVARTGGISLATGFGADQSEDVCFS
jgi:hypothetical protein